MLQLNRCRNIVFPAVGLKCIVMVNLACLNVVPCFFTHFLQSSTSFPRASRIFSAEPPYFRSVALSTNSWALTGGVYRFFLRSPCGGGAVDHTFSSLKEGWKGYTAIYEPGAVHCNLSSLGGGSGRYIATFVGWQRIYGGDSPSKGRDLLLLIFL